ncbi:MAG: ParB N-terminal domain-containing protein [Planctomycetota bacterium]|jgi:hypothetical protein
MDTKSCTMKFNLLHKVENCRIDDTSRGAVADLIESILAMGLIERLYVEVDGRARKGHRRIAALGYIKEENPERFAELFPNDEIPVIVVSNATDQELVALQIDHTQKGLSDYEILLACIMQFQVGWKPGNVGTHCHQLFINSPASQKKFDKRLEEIDVEAKVLGVKAREKGASPQEVEDIEAAHVAKETASYFKGVAQQYHRIWECPNIVLASFEFGATGKVPKGWREAELISKINKANAQTLLKAHKADLNTLTENDETKYSKAEPGPLFRAAWAKLKKQYIEKALGINKKTAFVRKTNAQIEEQATNFESHAFKGLCQNHLGKPAMDVIEIDKVFRKVEILKESAMPTDGSPGNPDDLALWNQMLDRADEIMVERRAAQEAADEHEAAETVEVKAKKHNNAKKKAKDKAEVEA